MMEDMEFDGGSSLGSEIVDDLIDGCLDVISLSVDVRCVAYVDDGVRIVLCVGVCWNELLNCCVALAAAPKKAYIQVSWCLLRPMPPRLRGRESWSRISGVMEFTGNSCFVV